MAIWRWPGLLGLLFLWVCTCAPAGADTDLPALRRLAAGGAKVSGLAVDLPSGRMLAGIEPETRLTPASLTKLYTAAASLAAWGPQKTFATEVLAGAPPRGGVVKGDLVFLGRGDATLTNAGLWQLAAQLTEAGVNRISGDLVVNQSLFGEVACRSEDRCDAKNGSRFAYDAPLSSAGINFGTWCVAVSPAERAGMRADSRLCQLSVPDVTLVGHIETVAAGRAGSIRVSRASERGRDRLFLSGKIAAGSPVRHIYRSAGNAPLQTGQIFREVLRRTGIRLDGDIRVSSAPVGDELLSLARVDSVTLAEQLMRMMTYSNNYLADTLALGLLAEVPGTARPLSLEAAGHNLLALTHREAPATAGAPLIFSGSGLTPDNALSAADIVALLKTMYLRTDLFPAFVGSLSVPAYTPLSSWGVETGWRTRIAAKTGSLQEPVTVSGVAGYFRQQNGGWGAFALLINGAEKRPYIPYSESTRALRQDVNRVLKKY